MAKRKFGASIIILCIAAVTLISGTYAWFLVGGFAELFDIGFDVIEASGSVLLRGDKLTFGGGNNDNDGWGDNLQREDFTDFSFIDKGGKYKPVSSTDGNSFIMVTMEDDDFICEGLAPSKSTGGITAKDVCYNDFTFYIKAQGDEITASEESGAYTDGAYIKINLTGDTFDPETGEIVKNEEDKGAAVAARVSLTYCPSSATGTKQTFVYSLDGKGYNAVTNQFETHTIVDTNAVLKESKYIIDSGDTGYTAAGLQAVDSPRLIDDEGNEVKIYLGNIPGFNDPGDGGVAGAGKEITIRIWLEGNDPDCFAFGEGAVAGKSLMSYISFGVDE